MRILTVDDSSLVRLVIKRTIDLLGFEFLEAVDGKDGLRVVDSNNGQIDLIILDRYMPVMDGLEMLKIIKSDENYKHIPISMVTVESEREEIQNAIDYGATNYLIKPFEREDLVGKILEGLGWEKMGEKDFSFLQ